MAWDGIRDRDRESEQVMARTTSILRWLPHALVYPLRGGRWLVILIIGGMLGFVAATWATIGVFALRALPILILALILLQRYLFLVLEHTAMGRAVPPNLMVDGVPRRTHAFFQTLFLGAAVLLTWSAFQLGVAVGSAMLMFWLFALPAATLVMLLAPRGFGWLSPVTMVRSVIKLGAGYLVAAAAILGGVLAAAFGSALGSGFVGALVGVYALILGHHLLGYLAFQRRDELGIEATHGPEVEAQRKRKALEAEVEQLLDRVHVRAAANQTREASRILAEELPETDDPLALQVALLETIMGWRNRELLAWQARRTLGALMEAGRKSRALSLMARCLASDKALVLGDEALTRALAAQAEAEGRPDLAKEITRGLAAAGGSAG